MTSHSADLPRPDVAVVGLGRPFTWLAGGWRDLWRRPAASLFYGLAVALCGGAILLTTARLPYLFTAAVSGFLLVAPLLATGLYDLSRGYERGEPVSLGESMQAWRRKPAAAGPVGGADHDPDGNRLRHGAGRPRRRLALARARQLARLSRSRTLIPSRP